MSSTLTPARAGRERAGRRPEIRRLLPGLILVLLALTGPFLAEYPLDKPVTAPFATPSGAAPLGGDQLGRDVLSRLLHGGTALIGSALLVAVLVTALAALVGCFAVLHPTVGPVVERTADVFILLPPILGTMLIALAWPGDGRWAVISAAVVLGTPYTVRVVAGAAGPLADAGYVEAALAGGESLTYTATRRTCRILALHHPRAVRACVSLRPSCHLHQAGFLQIGPQPPVADWALR